MKWSYHGGEWGNFTLWKLDFSRCCVDVLEYRHIKSFFFLFHSHSVLSLTNTDKNLQWTANWTAKRRFEDLTATFANVMISFGSTLQHKRSLICSSLLKFAATVITVYSILSVALRFYYVKIHYFINIKLTLTSFSVYSICGLPSSAFAALPNVLQQNIVK